MNTSGERKQDWWFDKESMETQQNMKMINTER